MEICVKHRAQATYYPKKDDAKGRDKVSFKLTEYQLPLPFYFVADVECILKPHDTAVSDLEVSTTMVTIKSAVQTLGSMEIPYRLDLVMVI